MSFHFNQAESPAQGVRRVFRERVDAALGQLRDCGRPAVIHGVRKEIKKLRAMFRLVRGKIDLGDYRKGTKALRHAADRLAPSRDARVILKTFDELAGGHGSRRFPNLHQALKKHCHREARRFRNHDFAGVTKRMLKQTGRRAAVLELKASGWAAIEPGLKQSYRRGKEACRRVHAESSPEHFHDWRKHVKDLWHFSCLLSPGRPAVTRARVDELALLGKLLGEDHDLFLLERFVAETCANHAGEMKALNRLIAARQRRLRAAALKLGSRLYAEPPAVVCRGMEKAWKKWQGKSRHK